MKKLIHKKWLSIPVTVFLVLVLSAGAVFAFAPVGTDQLITQVITAPVADPVYGSITADAIRLPSMETGDPYNANLVFGGNLVIVEVGPDGVGMWLHIKLDKPSASLYTMYGVSLWSAGATNPMGSNIQGMVQFGITTPDVLEASVQLTVAGSYIFDETVVATAGNTAGTAHVKVTYTLEDAPLP